MTSPCEFHDLDCPSPINFAAIAKQMHETALEAEERIYCLEQNLRAASNRPTYVATATTIFGPFGASFGSTTDGFALFTNAANMTINFTNMLTSTVAPYRMILPAGIWHIGACVSTSPVGAATDNSYRQLLLSRRRFNPSTGLAEPLDMVTRTGFESANGVPVLLTASGVFRFEGNEGMYFEFRHNNTASNVQVNVGAIAWATKLSDADVIRVI